MSAKNHDPDFGDFSVVYERSISSKKACYFAGYAISPDYPDHVYHYLQKVIDAGYEILFISSSPLTQVSLDTLKKYCYSIIEKDNKGTDFGAWKVALSNSGFGAGLDSLILANDSVFGPFRSIADDVEQMSGKFDLWGYTSSREVNYHIQSYFLHLGGKILRSEFWKNFWINVKQQKSKEDVIVNYEIGLTQQAGRMGFTTGAVLEADKLYRELKFPSPNLNFTITAWKELILLFNYPFLKKELFVKELANATNGGWSAVLKNKFGADSLPQVYNFLDSYKQDVLTKGGTAFRESSKDIIVLSHFGNRVTPNQILALNLAAQIARREKQDFLCYELSNTVHSALREISGHPGMKYLGNISSGLLEQYIYHWNKFNVRAIIIDWDTFRLFRSHFENFYSGNVIVALRNKSEVSIGYHLRTTLVDSIKFQLPDAESLSFKHCIRVNSTREFLTTDEFRKLKSTAAAKSVSIIWQEWANQISDDQPLDFGVLAEDLDPNAEDLEIVIEFDGYNFTITAHNDIVFFTDRINELCSQLEQLLETLSFDKFELMKSLTDDFFGEESLSEIYRYCFGERESNICRSPSTASFTHIFYDDTVFDLMPYLYNLSYLRDHQYFFTISEATVNRNEIAATLKAVFPGAYIQIVKNSGKDISGKLILLKLFFELGLKADYLLMLHDKKSLHSWAVEGSQWRNELFKIVEPGFIFDVFAMFEKDTQLGVIGSQKWLNNTDYDYNKRRFAFHDAFFRKKLKEYRITIENYEFVGGTMFWMRDELLRLFFEKYSLLEILGKLEHGNILDSKEGTETHFLERFFGWFATSEKYGLAGV